MTGWEHFPARTFKFLSISQIVLSNGLNNEITEALMEDIELSIQTLNLFTPLVNSKTCTLPESPSTNVSMISSETRGRFWMDVSKLQVTTRPVYWLIAHLCESAD